MKDADAMVFVVDDDSSIREAIKNLVSLVGLGVETFGTAQEFLRSERPDLPGCVVLMWSPTKARIEPLKPSNTNV